MSYNKEGSYPVFYWISFFKEENTQGNKQCIIKLGIFFPWINANYKQSYFKLEKAESAIIRLHYVLLNKLTAPILLPHPITEYPFIYFKYLAARSTSFDYLIPSVI